jgi:hypothetical protein
MTKSLTAKELAKVAMSLLANLKDGEPVVVEFVRDGRVGRLSQLRYALGDNGRPTTRRVDCLEDGVPVTYDGQYQFLVTTITINGKRLDFTRVSS